MGFMPKIPPRKRTFTMKQCARCGEVQGSAEYSPTKSLFFADGVLPICNSCVKEILKGEEWDWQIVDKICQMSDIPFIPSKWEELRDANGDDTFPVYARVFSAQCYESIGWGDYYKDFKLLEENGLIEDELPKISDKKYHELKEKWGYNYSIEDLCYLEDLYNGIIATQNINGALQLEQGKQLCQMSLEIRSRIREGADFDKLITSYEKFEKVSGLTPENIKSSGEFDSTGEVIRWLEKRGWVNQYYDDITRDVLDEMIKNFQEYNQRLYVNETGIGEEISRRIEQLKMAEDKESDNFYGTDATYNLDEYDNDVYNELMKSNDEFKEEI